MPKCLVSTLHNIDRVSHYDCSTDISVREPSQGHSDCICLHPHAWDCETIGFTLLRNCFLLDSGWESPVWPPWCTDPSVCTTSTSSLAFSSIRWCTSNSVGWWAWNKSVWDLTYNQSMCIGKNQYSHPFASAGSDWGLMGLSHVQWHRFLITIRCFRVWTLMYV